MSNKHQLSHKQAFSLALKCKLRGFWELLLADEKCPEKHFSLWCIWCYPRILSFGTKLWLWGTNMLVATYLEPLLFQHLISHDLIWSFHSIVSAIHPVGDMIYFAEIALTKLIQLLEDFPAKKWRVSWVSDCSVLLACLYVSIVIVWDLQHISTFSVVQQFVK